MAVRPIRGRMAAGASFGTLCAAVLLSCIGCSLSHERATPDGGGLERVDTGLSFVDAESFDRADGRYVGVIAGDDISGTFALTIAEGTLTGSATLEDSGMQQTHPIEVSSGDPSSGSFEVRVGDFHGETTISDGSVTVDLQSSDGGEAVARADGTRTEGDSEFFCGTYSGGDSGRWNFVITAEGDLAGSFWGPFSDGTLNGERDGPNVSISWHGRGGAVGEVSGSATGTITDSAIEGTWSGSGFSGTWTTTQTCPGG